MICCRNIALLLLLLPAALSAPAIAGFNDLLQVICDADNFIVAGCDATPDGLNFVNRAAVSSDDKHVYICSSQEDPGGDPSPQAESLSAFSRAVDGTLTLVDQEIEGSGGVTTLDSCRGVAVSPDGKHVYTAALIDSAVTWFGRNAMTGALTFTAGDAVSGPGPGSSLAGANAVAVSPDSKHVYVAARSGDAVAVFSRNTTTGDLTSIQDLFDGLAGVDGLDLPEDIAVSPDGKHVYVASEGDDAVAVFSRETNTASANFGKLTFVEAKFDGVGGVDGIAEAASVALDPTGANVYVATEVSSGAGDWFAVFTRNSATGALTFLQDFKDTAVQFPINCSGVGPTNSAIAVSPSGLFVAVSSPFRAGLATFSRATDGALTFVEAICDDLFVNSDDLGAIVDLAVSADGKSLYTAGGPFSTLSTVDYECDSANVDLILVGVGVSTGKSETACRSIEASDYDVLAAGMVTMTAPRVAFGDDVSVTGTLTIVNSVP